MQTIALIAHDGKKDDMVRFTSTERDLLAQFHLVATGTTGERIMQATGLPVERMLSGPYEVMHKSPPGWRKGASWVLSF